MMKRFNYAEKKLVVCDNEKSSFIAFVNPDEAERKYLVETLKLDEHTLNSALDPDELSRLEFEPEHIAIIFKRPRNYSARDQFLFKVSSIGAFLFRDKLIIVLADDIPIFENMTFNRPPTPAFVMLRMIYRSIFHFLEHLRIISQISDELQNKINTAMENRHLINLFTLEKSLEYYLNSINSNGALIEKLRANSAKIGFDNEEIELLDDTHIENNQCFKQAEIYSNILASLMDARASIVSNNLNVLLKTLNIITICIMVPTLVVSIFSMNVSLPVIQEGTTSSFWQIMVLALLSVMLVIFVWRFRRW
jgi:magnesium transporter